MQVIKITSHCAFSTETINSTNESARFDRVKYRVAMTVCYYTARVYLQHEGLPSGFLAIGLSRMSDGFLFRCNR